MNIKIKEIAKLINNKIETDELTNSNYISTENMLQNFGGITTATNVPSGKCTNFNKNDILLSNIRPYFKKTWFATFSGGCSNDVIVIRANENICLSKYLFYILNTNDFVNTYVASCKGTKMPRGNKDVLLDWEIDLPNIKVQQHIINTIGSVDDLIEENNKIIKKLEHFIVSAYEKSLNNNIIKAGDIFDCKMGGTFKSDDYCNFSKEKLITIKNINATGFDATNPTYFTLKDCYKKFKLNKGDLLLTMTGAYLGRSGIVDEDNCYLNQRLMKIECISKSFSYAFLVSNENNIFLLGKGSAQPNLSLEDFKNMSVHCDKNTVISFSKYDCFYDYILLLKIKNTKLVQIKSKLMNYYFTNQ